MLKVNYIDSYMRVTKARLEKELKEEATEGEYMFETYKLVSKELSHIIVGRLNAAYEQE